MTAHNSIFYTDAYKASHALMSLPGTQQIYSNFTPRFDKYFKDKFKSYNGEIVWFGAQAGLIKILDDVWYKQFFQRPKDEVISEARRVFEKYMGVSDMSNFEALHDLGYLPLEIKILPEGSITKIGIPCLTITNTHPDFQWLPNYLETYISAELWKPMTVATIVYTLRKLINKFAMETDGNLDNTDYQLHDFSFRGQSGAESSAISGAAFLTSSKGTDNIVAIADIERYYNTTYTDTFNVANSVPAGEHSVTTLGIQVYANKYKEDDVTMSDETALRLGEIAYIQYILTQFNDGIVSYVADSYDYFRVLDDILIVPTIKAMILSRNGKFVIRGDSGDPVEIIAGIKIKDCSIFDNVDIASSTAIYDSIDIANVTPGHNETIFKHNGNIYKATAIVEIDKYKRLSNVSNINHEPYVLSTQERGTIERLWDIFGGTINDMGYKVLNSHIGMIYGDGINEERATEIMTRLKDKGFSSTSIVFGVGSYTLNMLSRDDLGTAIKATSAVVDGKRIAIYKDPKTDSSKKSAKGLLRVDLVDGEYVLTDDVSEEEERGGALQTVWRDGNFVYTETFEDVINTLQSMQK